MPVLKSLVQCAQLPPLTWATELGGARGGRGVSREASLGFCVLADYSFLNSWTRPGDGGASPTPRRGSAPSPARQRSAGPPRRRRRVPGGVWASAGEQTSGSEAAAPSLPGGHSITVPGLALPTARHKSHIGHMRAHRGPRCPLGYIHVYTRAGRALCCRPAPALHTATGHCVVGP